MSFVSKIPRLLLVLLVMAVCAVLVWQLAFDTDYFYYAAGAAVVIILAVVFLVFRPFKKSSGSGKAAPVDIKRNAPDGYVPTEPATIEIEPDYTDSPAILRGKSTQSFQAASAKPSGVDEARRYTKMAAAGSEDALITRPITGQKPVELATEEEMDSPEAAGETAANPAEEAAENQDTPHIPLVEDETVLTEDDKNILLNAVWYRCENPYCKYTNFLGVHHIVEEKNGGTNKLDNLIVLCPFCHDLAHRGEIPETEMREWISHRETRFKSRPDWKYY